MFPQDVFDGTLHLRCLLLKVRPGPTPFLRRIRRALVSRPTFRYSVILKASQGVCNPDLAIAAVKPLIVFRSPLLSPSSTYTRDSSEKFPRLVKGMSDSRHEIACPGALTVGRGGDILRGRVIRELSALLAWATDPGNLVRVEGRSNRYGKEFPGAFERARQDRR